jgi:hypothetical protein
MKRHLLMSYPDLRSLADVDALPMPEFNLRVHCLIERIKWAAGIFGEPEPKEERKPAGKPKQSFAEILLEIKQAQVAKENDASTTR